MKSQSYSPTTGKHTVEFEDGAVEDLVLAREDFRWLSAGSRGGELGGSGSNASGGDVTRLAEKRGSKRKREESDGSASEKKAGDYYQRKLDAIARLAAAGVLTKESAELAKSKLVAEFVSMV